MVSFRKDNNHTVVEVKVFLMIGFHSQCARFEKIIRLVTKSCLITMNYKKITMKLSK